MYLIISFAYFLMFFLTVYACTIVCFVSIRCNRHRMYVFTVQRTVNALMVLCEAIYREYNVGDLSQINYTQMGNVFRLHNRIEPSAALFWALGIVLAHILKQLTQPSIPQVRQGSVRFNLKEEEPPSPLFPSCCILILLNLSYR